MTHQITIKKRLNSGQIHATSHSSMMLNYNSARCKNVYKPDLIFASGSIANMCGKSIMDPIPHTQHRPICVSAHPVMVPQTIPLRQRFIKADWNGYSAELDKLIENVKPIPANYKCFVECTCSIQKTHTKRMSNRIRSRSYWRIKESIWSIQVQVFNQPLWRWYHRIWKHMIDKMTEEKGRDGRKSSRPSLWLTIAVKRRRRLESCLMTLPHPILYV